ncbi:hypothetical protein D3C73_1308810 [compost metagenome]
MGAHQVAGRFGHALDIQRAVVPGDFFVQVRRTDLVVVDHIAIAPGNGLEPGMEMRRHDLGPTDADIVGQIDIGTHDPGLHRTLDLRVEVHDLATGVHAGIGAPGAEQRNGRVGHLGQGVFEGFLHREHARGLALPATITRALVFNAQRDPEKAVGRHFGGRVIYICQGVTAC